MISIVLNGQEHRMPERATVETLLQSLDIKPGRLAVEINREIVPRTRYAEAGIREGDRIEIVTLVGGG